MTTIRDHTVNNVRDSGNDLLAAFTLATQKLNGLAAEKSEADENVARLVEELQSGEGSVVTLTAAAERAQSLANELNAARAEAAALAIRKSAADRVQREDQFQRAVETARKTRASFAEHFRASCLSLGEFFKAQETAIRVSTETANAAGGIMSLTPETKATVAEITQPVDPTSTLLDSGLSVTDGVGFNVSIRVLPMRPKFSQEEQ